MNVKSIFDQCPASSPSFRDSLQAVQPRVRMKCSEARVAAKVVPLRKARKVSAGELVSDGVTIILKASFENSLGSKLHLNLLSTWLQECVKRLASSLARTVNVRFSWTIVVEDPFRFQDCTAQAVFRRTELKAR